MRLPTIFSRWIQSDRKLWMRSSIQQRILKGERYVNLIIISDSGASSNKTNDPGLAQAVSWKDDIRSQLQETDLKIRRLRAQLGTLIQKRALLESKFNNHASCPVFRFPPEITTQIFLNCFPTINPRTISGHSKTTTPFQLGHICHAWRELVWSTPSLWCTICLNMNSVPHILLLEEWLLRSRQLPISVYIFGTWNFSEPRWHPKLLFLQNHFSRLQTLSLQHLGSPPSWSQRYGLFRVNSVPSLRNIHLSGLLLEQFGFPLQHITQFLLTFSSIVECLKVIKRSPCLIHGIFASIPKTSVSLVLQAVSAPCLQSLTLYSVYVIPELLDHLTSPALRELVAVGTKFPFSNLISLITRSSCSLERLSLSGARIQGSELLQCLWLTPSIVELSLSSQSLGDEIVRLLDPSPNHESTVCMLPNLRVLEYAGQFDINNLTISDMLLTRQQEGLHGMVTQLQRLSLRTHSLCYPHQQAMSQYRQLIAAGLALFVGTDKERWL